MAYGKAAAAEIDKQLREEFKQRLQHLTSAPVETTDPVLGVIFRTFATQLEALYSETERIRLGLLDELMAGLNITPRMARPAQTVVRFSVETGSVVLEEGTQLLGQQKSGSRPTFSTDADIAVSTARIALAVTYQYGLLKLVPGVELTPRQWEAPRSLRAVPINLGVNPAIILAIENLPETHLGQHGFFFELSSDALDVQRALYSERWCLAGSDGEFGPEGILQPRRINAGVRQLTWLRNAEIPANAASVYDGFEAERTLLSDGFYGGQTFLFPAVPASRQRFICQVPRGFDAALTELLGSNAAQLFQKERAWLRISMPPEIVDMHTALAGISLNAVSASNLECLNETIDLEKQGASIPVTWGGETGRYLVTPLAVLGERGPAYISEFEPCIDPNVGRFGLHNGRIELKPAKHPGNSEDKLVNLRLLLTCGEQGNSVLPGQIQTIALKSGTSGLRVTNLTTSAGGINGEGYQDAQRRFAQVLLSRDRIVTRADLTAAVRSFDRRVRGVEIASILQRTPGGLERVHQVRLTLKRSDFLEGDVGSQVWKQREASQLPTEDEEVRALKEDLAVYCSERFVEDAGLSIEVIWT